MTDRIDRRVLVMSLRCLLLAAAFASVRWLADVWQWPLLDLDVYRRGAGELLHGRSLYDAAPHFPHPDLPFTYPPFSAAAFVPAYLAGPVVAGVLLSLASLGCYALVMLTCARRLGLAWSTAVPLSVLGLAIEPVQRTFWLGQVNLLLAAMIVADCFLVPARARGVLIGLAAGIKIIPGIYVVYFLLRRDWASVVRAAGRVPGERGSQRSLRARTMPPGSGRSCSGTRITSASRPTSRTSRSTANSSG